MRDSPRQPVSTAPKTGQRILVEIRFPDGSHGQEIVKWNFDSQRWQWGGATLAENMVKGWWELPRTENLK